MLQSQLQGLSACCCGTAPVPPTNGGGSDGGPFTITITPTTTSTTFLVVSAQMGQGLNGNPPAFSPGVYTNAGGFSFDVVQPGGSVGRLVVPAGVSSITVTPDGPGPRSCAVVVLTGATNNLAVPVFRQIALNAPAASLSDAENFTGNGHLLATYGVSGAGPFGSPIGGAATFVSSQPGAQKVTAVGGTGVNKVEVFAVGDLVTGPTPVTYSLTSIGPNSVYAIGSTVAT